MARQSAAAKDHRPARKSAKPMIEWAGKDLPNLDVPLPASDTLKHFGKGQTEAKLELAPGKHTLRLVLGDKIHLPHSPAVISKEITITVE